MNRRKSLSGQGRYLAMGLFRENNTYGKVSLRTSVQGMS